MRQGAKGSQTDRESGNHGRHKTEKLGVKETGRQEAKRPRDGETRRQRD